MNLFSTSVLIRSRRSTNAKKPLALFLTFFFLAIRALPSYGVEPHGLVTSTSEKTLVNFCGDRGCELLSPANPMVVKYMDAYFTSAEGMKFDTCQYSLEKKACTRSFIVFPAKGVGVFEGRTGFRGLEFSQVSVKPNLNIKVNIKNYPWVFGNTLDESNVDAASHQRCDPTTANVELSKNSYRLALRNYQCRGRIYSFTKNLILTLRELNVVTGQHIFSYNIDIQDGATGHGSGFTMLNFASVKDIANAKAIDTATVMREFTNENKHKSNNFGSSSLPQVVVKTGLGDYAEWVKQKQKSDRELEELSQRIQETQTKPTSTSEAASGNKIDSYAEWVKRKQQSDKELEELSQRIRGTEGRSTPSLSVATQTDRIVTITAPEVCENGAVCPVNITFNPPLGNGQYFQIYLNDQITASTSILDGSLSEFGYRVMLDRSANSVSIDCPGCKKTVKQIRSVKVAKRSQGLQASETKDLRIRATAGDFRALISALDINSGEALLDGVGMVARIQFDGRIAPNPYFGLKGSLQEGNHCFFFRNAGVPEVSRCTQSARPVSQVAQFHWRLPSATEIDAAVKDAYKDQLNLTVKSTNPDPAGIVILNISTNTDTRSLKINGDEEGARTDGRYTLKRFASVGENRFDIVATDRFGNTRQQVVTVKREVIDSTVRFSRLNPAAVRQRSQRDAAAIIIGIQDYRRVPKADFANNDARVFYDYAIRGLGVKPENIRMLIDAEADDIGILSAIRSWLPLKVKRHQTEVFVFYSGHGLPSNDGKSLYILPHGVDRNFLERTAINQEELISALQSAQPRNVTMFLDACYSGQSRGGDTLLASARPIAIKAKTSSVPANFTVISASSPEELASSSPEVKHGIFSYWLMKGIEGEADSNKDGQITAAELREFLADSVGRMSAAQGRVQRPQAVGELNRVLVQK